MNDLPVGCQSGIHLIAPYVRATSDSPLRFADLGAGDGALTELILDSDARSTGVLVDFSEPMVEKAKARLQRSRSMFIPVLDMNLGDWPPTLAGPFDAILSSAAIHHLSNDRKMWLYERR